MVEKLADHAALGAAVSPAGPIQPGHQIGGGFEGNQLLRVGLNVNSHAVITGDDTVLSRRETPVYDWVLALSLLRVIPDSWINADLVTHIVPRC